MGVWGVQGTQCCATHGRCLQILRVWGGRVSREKVRKVSCVGEERGIPVGKGRGWVLVFVIRNSSRSSVSKMTTSRLN